MFFKAASLQLGSNRVHLQLLGLRPASCDRYPKLLPPCALAEPAHLRLKHHIDAPNKPLLQSGRCALLKMRTTACLLIKSGMIWDKEREKARQGERKGVLRSTSFRKSGSLQLLAKSKKLPQRNSTGFRQIDSQENYSELLHLCSKSLQRHEATSIPGGDAQRTPPRKTPAAPHSRTAAGISVGILRDCGSDQVSECRLCEEAWPGHPAVAAGLHLPARLLVVDLRLSSAAGSLVARTLRGRCPPARGSDGAHRAAKALLLGPRLVSEGSS